MASAVRCVGNWPGRLDDSVSRFTAYQPQLANWPPALSLLFTPKWRLTFPEMNFMSGYCSRMVLFKTELYIECRNGERGQGSVRVLVCPRPRTHCTTHTQSTLPHSVTQLLSHSLTHSPAHLRAVMMIGLIDGLIDGLMVCALTLLRSSVNSRHK